MTEPAPSALAEYLYELGTTGSITDDARARALLVQAAIVLDQGASAHLVLQRLAGAALPDPYARRVAECLAELLTPAGDPPPPEPESVAAPAPAVPSFEPSAESVVRLGSDDP